MTARPPATSATTAPGPERSFRRRAGRPDLDLLATMDALTQHRVRVDVADAWEHLHGRPPAAGDWLMVRATVARLEREGLIRSDPALAIEVTDDGRALLRPQEGQELGGLDER